MSCNSCAVEVPRATRVVRSAQPVQAVRTIRNPQPVETYEVVEPVRTVRTVYPAERIELAEPVRVVRNVRPRVVEEIVERIPVETFLGPDSDILRPRLTGQCCPVVPRTTFPPVCCPPPRRVYGALGVSPVGLSGTVLYGAGPVYGADIYPSALPGAFSPARVYGAPLGGFDAYDPFALGAPQVLPPISTAPTSLAPLAASYVDTVPLSGYPAGISAAELRLRQLSGPRGVLASGAAPIGGVRTYGGYGGYSGSSVIPASAYDTGLGLAPVGGIRTLGYSAYDTFGVYPPARSPIIGVDPYFAGGSLIGYSQGLGYPAGYVGSRIGQRTYGGRVAGGCSSCSI